MAAAFVTAFPVLTHPRGHLGRAGDGVTLGDCCADGACVVQAGPVQPHQQKWVPVHAEGSGAHVSPSQHLLFWSSQGAGVCSLSPGAQFGLGHLQLLAHSLGCVAGVPESCDGSVAALGWVATLPASLGVSLLKAIMGSVLLLRCYSRKSS